MKSSLCTFALATFVAIASLTQAHAQTHASRVNVPFAFDCGSEHFAAGIYTISFSDSGVLTVTDYKHTDMAIPLSRFDQDSTDAAPYVAFRKYGNNYFLAAYHANGGVTIDLGKSAKERNLARELALNPTDSGTVRLAMLNDAASGR
ncbi:MAG: hypothetical protein ABSD43_01520 [Terracidiphilus sp.]|jgi:hypothetical protein